MATYKVDGDKITKTKVDCTNINTAGQYYNINPVGIYAKHSLVYSKGFQFVI